ncbi:MAG: hypothetical protein ABJF10_22670 [Chthoniobacter sp.]
MALLIDSLGRSWRSGKMGGTIRHDQTRLNAITLERAAPGDPAAAKKGNLVMNLFVLSYFAAIA